MSDGIIGLSIAFLFLYIHFRKEEICAAEIIQRRTASDFSTEIKAEHRK